MPVKVIGISHRTAPLEIRERFVFDSAQLHDILNRLVRDGLAEEAVLLSTCNRTELYYVGASGEKAVRQLLDALTTLPLDTQAADEAATIRRVLERSGTPIGMGDSLIAGIVRARRGLLLTRNRRHFDRVEGLNLSLLAARP